MIPDCVFAAAIMFPDISSQVLIHLLWIAVEYFDWSAVETEPSRRRMAKIQVIAGTRLTSFSGFKARGNARLVRLNRT